VNRKQFLMVIIAAVGATLVNDAMAVENAVSRLILSTLTPMTVMTGNITQLVRCTAAFGPPTTTAGSLSSCIACVHRKPHPAMIPILADEIPYSFHC